MGTTEASGDRPPFSPGPGNRSVPDRVDLLRLDGDDDADLAAAPVPRVGGAGVALGQSIDVLGAALGGDADDLPADRVVAGRAGRVAHAYRHPRVALDVPQLLVSLDGVDDDVLAVGVDPGLGQLGRAVGHQGGQEAGGWLAQQGDQVLAHVHARWLPSGRSASGAGTPEGTAHAVAGFT